MMLSLRDPSPFSRAHDPISNSVPSFASSTDENFATEFFPRRSATGHIYIALPRHDYLHLHHRLQTHVVTVEHSVVLHDGRRNGPGNVRIAPHVDLQITLLSITYHREAELSIVLDIKLRYTEMLTSHNLVSVSTGAVVGA